MYLHYKKSTVKNQMKSQGRVQCTKKNSEVCELSAIKEEKRESRH